MIADNRLAEQASWDQNLLAEQFKEFLEVELDFDLEATGFEVGEIDILLEESPSPVKRNWDPADDLPAANPFEVTRAGDLWLAGPHRIYCGDSLNSDNYSTLMESRRAAMAFIDPPLNVEIGGHASGGRTTPHSDPRMLSGEISEAAFTDFLARIMQQCGLHSVDGSLNYAVVDWRHMPELLAAGRRARSELINVCVWVKNNSGKDSPYRSQHELVFVFKNAEKNHRCNVERVQKRKSRTNVWHYRDVDSFRRSTDEGNSRERNRTITPVALIADAITDCTSRGDVVLDPFLGSGSTVIAAERTRRVCHGIELDPQKVDTSVRRWQAFTGQSATLQSSGRTFAETEQEAGNERKR
jgi:DNA modification methylase